MSELSYVEVQSILDENGLSKSDVDALWKEAKQSNLIVQNLAEHGKNWTDLPVHLIKDLIKRYGNGGK